MPIASSYPPGVTGLEPQIAGYRTRTYQVWCDADEAPAVGKALVDDLTGRLRAALTGWHPAGYDRVAAATAILDEAAAGIDAAAAATPAPCQFNGLVDADYDGRHLYWTCPWCGTDHDDPDDE